MDEYALSPLVRELSRKTRCWRSRGILYQYHYRPGLRYWLDQLQLNWAVSESYIATMQWVLANAVANQHREYCTPTPQASTGSAYCHWRKYCKGTKPQFSIRADATLETIVSAYLFLVLSNRHHVRLLPQLLVPVRPAATGHGGAQHHIAADRRGGLDLPAQRHLRTRRTIPRRVCRPKLPLCESPRPNPLLHDLARQHPE